MQFYEDGQRLRPISSFPTSKQILLLLLTLLCLNGCGGGGGGSSAQATSTTPVLPDAGPGDTDEIFPLGSGDSWNYRITEVEDVNGVAQMREYVSVFRVSGTRLVSGVTADVILEDNPDDTGIAVENYFQKVGGGVINWGDSDVDDPITPTLVPFTELLFPAVPGTTFIKHDSVGSTDDIDGDGISESFAVSSNVAVTAIEDIETTAGVFRSTRRVEEDLTLSITSSLTGERVNGDVSIVTSYAPSVGAVKESVTQRTSIGNNVIVDSNSVDLIGFYVGGTRKGIQPEFPISHPGVTQPCEPAVGYDGNRFLIVFHARQNGNTQLFGKFISIDGQQSSVFPVTDSSVFLELCSVGARPVIAFDGNNYLLAYRRNGRIFGIRIMPDGTVLDPGGGFQISNIVNQELDNAPAIQFDGTSYLVAWHKNIFTQTPEGLSIHGAFVSTAGVPSNTFTIASNNGTEKAYPSLSFDGSNYLVAWTDKRNAPINGHHIYAARITQQGIVLEPDGFPVTETDSTKFVVHAKFEGNQHRLSWWDEDFGQPRVFYKKHITPDGDILDLPTTSNGLPVSTRNIARIGSVLIGGEGLLDVWMTSSILGANSVANTAEMSLIVWERSQTLYGAFVYPRSK